MGNADVLEGDQVEQVDSHQILRDLDHLLAKLIDAGQGR
jgi:hypothetical protein